MSNCVFTQEFSDWAHLIGYKVVTHTHEWLVSDFGETTYVIRFSGDMYTLACLQWGREQFIMSTTCGTDIERLLTVLLGDDIRAVRGLPRIGHIARLDGLCPDCQTRIDDTDRVVLMDSQGQMRGVFRAPIDVADRIIWFSWILEAPLGDLRASYLDPEGLPLFPGCWIGPTLTGLEQTES